MRAAFSCVALLSFVAACGGSSFDGRIYDDGKLRFRTGPIPASWRRIEADGTLLAFRDDRRDTTMAVNGRCGVDGDDVPLVSLTQHLFLHFTDREIKSQREVMLDERAALRTEIVGKLDGVPMHFLVYVMKKNGCVYDFWRIGAAPPPSSDAALHGPSAEFELFVQGFSTER
jgi:hypothetical protein